MADTGKKIKELTDASSLNGTDNIIVEDSTPKTKKTTLTKLKEWIQSNIDISGKGITFTAASTRGNVASGNTLAVFAGKFAKLYTDLKSHAFTSPIQNLTTTVTGSALDATMGKKLQDNINELNTKIVYSVISPQINNSDYYILWDSVMPGYILVNAYNSNRDANMVCVEDIQRQNDHHVIFFANSFTGQVQLTLIWIKM